MSVQFISHFRIGGVNNKKEKRPSWEKIVGGWEIENETDWNWMVSFGRKESKLNTYNLILSIYSL